MKKALITMIIILSAFILGIVMFVVGVQITSEKDNKDSVKSDAAASLAGKEALDSASGNNDGQAATPLDPEYDPLPEQETEEETKPEPESKPEPEAGIELEPDAPATSQQNSQTSYPDYPQNSNEWYRVRTSAGSDGKQDGAFKSFSNAKAHANTLKAQGYKVYDNNMNCIYTP